MTRGKLLAVLVTVAFALPGCVQDDGSCAAYGAGEKTDFYHVGSSGKAPLTLHGAVTARTKHGIAAMSHGPLAPVQDLSKGAVILGYIFGIATEEMQTEQQALNITLHGTNYSTDELEPRPSREIGGVVSSVN